MFETDPIAKAIFDALNKCEGDAFSKWHGLWRLGRIAEVYMGRLKEGEFMIHQSTPPPAQPVG